MCSSFQFKKSLIGFTICSLMAVQGPSSWALDLTNIPPGGVNEGWPYDLVKADNGNLRLHLPENPQDVEFSTLYPFRLLASFIFAPITSTSFLVALPLATSAKGVVNVDFQFREVINAAGADAADFLATDGERDSALLIALKKSIRSQAAEQDVDSVLSMDDQELAKRIIAAVDQI